MEAKAIARYVRISLIKVGVVLDLIRGENVSEVLTTLEYTPRDVAEVISKVLKSAVANTENNYELDASRLFVAGAHVGRGSTLEKFRPMNHGRASRMNKRTSSITPVIKGGV